VVLVRLGGSRSKLGEGKGEYARVGQRDSVLSVFLVSLGSRSMGRGGEKES
jgi:hypothetical protein